MKASIAVLAGDGIGPEVIAEAERCLQTIALLFGHSFALIPAAFGGVAIDAPLPKTTHLGTATVKLTMPASRASFSTSVLIADFKPVEFAVTAQADSDPDSAEALSRLTADRVAALNDLLRPSGIQIAGDEYALLSGPVLACIFFERRAVTDEFIAASVTQWLAARQQSERPPA